MLYDKFAHCMETRSMKTTSMGLKELKTRIKFLEKKYNNIAKISYSLLEMRERFDVVNRKLNTLQDMNAKLEDELANCKHLCAQFHEELQHLYFENDSTTTCFEPEKHKRAFKNR